MIEQPFSLVPFPSTQLPDLAIRGVISLENNHLSLRYTLSGNMAEVFLPPISLSPSRKDDLWKSTCFEFFVALRGQPQYWEFNMSPSGDWNIYRMDDYRRVGFREETLIQELPFAVQREANQFFLTAQVDLEPIIHAGQTLEVGITAVVQTAYGQESFWALGHPGTVADFHLRETFILPLAEQLHSPQESMRSA